MSSSKPRAIDALPNKPRERPMEVLCLGLSRTATMSMHEALTKLGYKTYHFKEVGQNDVNEPMHIDPWNEAFNAKMYGNGKPYGRAEFDRLLRRYSAVTDAPCACFADELIEAYPDAKVILTNRDPQKWLASMETAYYHILCSEPFKWFRALAMLCYGSLDNYLELLRFPLRMWTADDWQNRAKLLQTFDAHYAHVRAIVPSERLLEWTAKDGWEPLCRFLDKPVPREPFPHINKGYSAADLHTFLGWIYFWQLMRGYAWIWMGWLVGLGLVSVLVLGGAVWVALKRS